MGKAMRRNTLNALAAILIVTGTASMATEKAAPKQAPSVAVAAVAPQPETKPKPAVEEQKFGPVTRLPMPRFVSMKASKGNARRGPSVTHRIDWVFMRRNMPLQIIAEFGHWRRVVDHEGAGGWIHHSLLSGVRTVLVQKDMLDLHLRPNEKSPVSAQLEIGVVARLSQCTPDWCRVSVSGYRGWAPKSALWGVDADEVRD